MFGYIRPYKPELLMKDFTKYKSIYCGICKNIKSNYNNINRLALTYDMTFFALLYLSLYDDNGEIKQESCFLNPVKKKPILYNHIALDKAASLSMVFAYSKIKDDINDEKNIFLKNIYKFEKLFFNNAYTKSLYNLGDNTKEIFIKLDNLYKEESIKIEGVANYEKTSKLFGEVLESAFKLAFNDAVFENNEQKNKQILEALEQIGIYLGRWIYIIDAIEDYDDDKKSKRFNPFFPLDKDEAKSIAENILIEYEEQLDLIAALLPYKRDGSIIYNIINLGLKHVRQQIWRGERLAKL